MENPIEEIKSRIDIVELVGSYLKLQKVGANYRALCPFHAEKNPSFFVSPARQIWHCFGCQKGGDIFAFVKEIEGVEFGDALRILAKRAGVDLKPLPKEAKTKRKRIYEILELATKFFEKQLAQGNVGKEAKNYLLSRGLKEETIKKWRLGWAPNQPSALLDFLVSKGFKKTEVEEVGLAIKTERGNFFDRFRSRIMFPIFDLNSQVVGFGGRIFKIEEGAKYINTPNTLVYDKSKILYGLDKARVEIRRKDFAILVEGYIDCILSHQAGFENTVSISGTALTPYQLKILQRYTDNLYLAFDMDVGGESATERSINLAQSLGFNLKIIILEEGKDPADTIMENEEKWKNLIEKAQPIMEYYFERLTKKFSKDTLEGKKSILKVLLPVIKQIPHEIERSFWLETLSNKISVKVEDLLKEMQKIKTDQEKYGLELEEILVPTKTRKEILEERLIVLILKYPEAKGFFNKDNLEYFSQKAKIVLESMLEAKEVPVEFSDFFNYLCLKAEVEEIEVEEIKSEIEFCEKEILKLKAKEELEKISQQIKLAEMENDFEKIKQLNEEFNFWKEKIK